MTMKLHFEDNLDFQLSAIASVIDLFKGQQITHSEFTVPSAYKKLTNIHIQETLASTVNPGMTENDLGIGNRLLLTDDELKENLNQIQLKNGVEITQNLGSGDFTVEMETGTGKTYVYLRTIFELYINYGFTKFVIVVPSVAIKEGVYKSLEITREHFENLYPSIKGYSYFQYDSLPSLGK